MSVDRAMLPTTRQLLDEALALVVAATDALFALNAQGHAGKVGADLLRDDEVDLLLAGRRCLDLQTLLIHAGAVEAVPLDDDDAGPGVWLQRAAAALDAIAVDERPVLLAPARVELAAVLVTVPA